MRLPVGQLLLVGFSLHVKTDKTRDEIQPETQTSTSEGVQSLFMSSHGINHKWKTLVISFSCSNHSIPESGKEDVFTNSIKTNKVRSLSGLHSLV